MSLSQAVIVKIAVGTTAAALMAGGTAASVNRQSATTTRQAAAGALSPVPVETGGKTTSFDAVVDPATGTVRLVKGADAAGAGAAGGASAKGGPAGRGGRQLSSGAPATPAAARPGVDRGRRAGEGSGGCERRSG